MNNISHDAEDLRMEYSKTIDDIKYIKSRQWTVTYYLLLLYASIIGFYRIMDVSIELVCTLKFVLFILALSIGILGTLYHYDFQSRLQRYRKKLLKIVNNLSPEFSQIVKNGIATGYCSWFKGFWKFTFPFILMLWIGVGFVYCYIFLK